MEVGIGAAAGAFVNATGDASSALGVWLFSGDSEVSVLTDTEGSPVIVEGALSFGSSFTGPAVPETSPSSFPYKSSHKTMQKCQQIHRASTGSIHAPA